MEGSSIWLDSSLEIPVLWLWLIQLLLIIITDSCFYLPGPGTGNVLLGCGHRDSPEWLGTPHGSDQSAPHPSFLTSVTLSKATPSWSTWRTWRCCRGNLSCPSYGLSVYLQWRQDGHQWCPVPTLWKGSWCGSDSTCGCSPGSGRCPAEKETLSRSSRSTRPVQLPGTAQYGQPSTIMHTLNRMKSQASQAGDRH